MFSEIIFVKMTIELINSENRALLVEKSFSWYGIVHRNLNFVNHFSSKSHFKSCNPNIIPDWAIARQKYAYGTGQCLSKKQIICRDGGTSRRKKHFQVRALLTDKSLFGSRIAHFRVHTFLVQVSFNSYPTIDAENNQTGQNIALNLNTSNVYRSRYRFVCKHCTMWHITRYLWIVQIMISFLRPILHYIIIIFEK